MKPIARFGLLALLTLVSITIVAFLNPVAQDPGFHLFADRRTIAGIPNFWNVISNVPFLIIGVYGLTLIGKSEVTRPAALIYSSLFLGILFTGVGSAYYHYAPGNNSLVFDRLPMTIVFMSFLSATIYEYINAKAGVWLLFPMIIIGIFSVLWWHHTENAGAGDLRVYGLVQFYPVVFIPLIIFLFPKPGQRKVLGLFMWIVLWYIIAKLLERFDEEIFKVIGFISGHSLKHLAAAMSTWYIVRLFKTKFIHP